MILPLILVALLQVPDPTAVEVGTSSYGRFAFDWSGLHEDGTSMAETTDVEFHFQPVPPLDGVKDGGHRTVKLPFVAVVGVNKVAMRDALVGIPEGIYDLSALLIGVGGNRSAHGSVLQVRVRAKRPAAPTGLRVDD